MVRKSVCKHALLSEVDNDGGFFVTVGILVDGLVINRVYVGVHVN